MRACVRACVLRRRGGERAARRSASGAATRRVCGRAWVHTHTRYGTRRRAHGRQQTRSSSHVYLDEALLEADLGLLHLGEDQIAEVDAPELEEQPVRRRRHRRRARRVVEEGQLTEHGAVRVLGDLLAADIDGELALADNVEGVARVALRDHLVARLHLGHAHRRHHLVDDLGRHRAKDGVSLEGSLQLEDVLRQLELVLAEGLKRRLPAHRREHLRVLRCHCDAPPLAL